MQYTEQAEQLVKELEAWDSVNMRQDVYIIDTKTSEYIDISSRNFDMERLFPEELIEEVSQELANNSLPKELCMK